VTTSPQDRQQAIDFMEKFLQEHGADQVQARKGAVVLVDKAIAERGDDSQPD
jgi:hypothetical protein